MQYLNKIRFIEIRFRKITKREIKGNHKKEKKLYCPKGEGLRNKFFFIIDLFIAKLVSLVELSKQPTPGDVEMQLEISLIYGHWVADK